MRTDRHTQTFFLLTTHMKMEQSVPKRRHIKFRRRRITQNKEYNIQNTAKVEIKNYVLNEEAKAHPLQSLR